MSGVLWAAAAGVVFGVFQSVNRGTLVEMDVYRSTFIQLGVSSAVLLAAVLATGDAAELARVPGAAYADFAAAGAVHFLVGWTLLNMSQKRIGAARTSPLLATVPLFGAALAAVTLHERPSGVAVLGMATIVLGVYVVQTERIRRTAPVALDGPRTAVAVDPGERVPLPTRLAASSFGLGAALAWAISPVFIRTGLDRYDSPLLGVTIGVVVATAAYGVLIGVRRRRGGQPVGPAPREARNWKLVAGLLVGLATWTRWYALSLAPVAVVLSLGLLSVPTVILLAPVAAGRHLERVTASVVAGSALVVAGALVLILEP
ncbi:MAG: EamA family transporter [Candidatus Velamenicoccus archaeovorus]